MENVNFNLFGKRAAEEWVDLRTQGKGGTGTNRDPRLVAITITFPRLTTVNIYARLGKQIAIDIGLNPDDRYCFLFSPNGDKVRLCKSPNGKGITMRETKGLYMFQQAFSNNVRKIIPHASKELVLVGQDEAWVSGGNAITWSLFGRRK